MATYANIGTVSVKVMPDTDGFGKKAKREIESQIKRQSPAEVEVDPKVNDVTGPLNDEVREAQATDPTIKVDTEVEDIRPPVKKAQEQAQDYLDKNPLDTGISGNLDKAMRDASSVLQRAKRDWERSNFDLLPNSAAAQAARDWQNTQGMKDAEHFARARRELENGIGEAQKKVAEAAEKREKRLQELVRSRIKLQQEYEDLRDKEGNAARDERESIQSRIRQIRILSDTIRNQTATERTNLSNLQRTAQERSRIIARAAEDYKALSSEQREALVLRQRELREIEALQKREARELEAHHRKLESLAKKHQREAEALRKREARELDLHRKARKKLLADMGDGAGRGGAGVMTPFWRLGGGRLARNLAGDVWEPLANFDIHMPKLMLMSALLNQISASVMALGGNILTLGRDVARIVPALLAVPGLFVSAGVGIASLVVGLSDLGERLPGVADAYKTLGETMSLSFWGDGMDQRRIGDALWVLFDPIETGLKSTSRAAGGWFAEAIESMAEIVAPAMGDMFEGVSESFRIFEGATDGIAVIIKELGVLGGIFAPQATQAFTDAINQFGTFLAVNAANGNLVTWIEDAWQAIKDLGSVAGSTFSFLNNLSWIAELGGGASLRDLAEGMAGLSKAIMQPQAVNTMVELFQAAHETVAAFADNLGPGLGAFFNMVGDVAGHFGPTMAGAAGGMIGDLLQGFDSPAVREGVKNFATEFAKLRDIIGPVLTQSSEVVGILDTINAAIVPFGQLAATAVGGLLYAIDDLGPHLVASIEGLAPGIQTLFEGLFLPLTEGVVEFGPQFAEIAGSVGNLMSTIGGEVHDLVAGVMETINSRDVSGVIDSITSGVGGLLAGSGESIASVFENVFDVVFDVVKLFGQGLEILGGINQMLHDIAGIGVWDILAREINRLIEPLQFVMDMLQHMQAVIGEWGKMAGLYDVNHLDPNSFRRFNRDEGRLPELTWETGEERQVRLDLEKQEWDAKLEEARREREEMLGWSKNSITMSLEGAIRGLAENAGAVSKYWDTFGSGADGYAGKVQSAIAAVDDAIKNSQYNIADYDGDWAAMFAAIEADGGAAGDALETAMAGLQQVLDDTGLGFDTLYAKITSGNLDDATIAGLLEIAEDIGELPGMADEYQAFIDKLNAADAGRKPSNPIPEIVTPEALDLGYADLGPSIEIGSKIKDAFDNANTEFQSGRERLQAERDKTEQVLLKPLPPLPKFGMGEDGNPRPGLPSTGGPGVDTSQFDALASAAATAAAQIATSTAGIVASATVMQSGVSVASTGAGTSMIAMSGAVAAAAGGFASAMSSMVGAAIAMSAGVGAAASTAAGRVRGAFAGAGGWLVGAGAAIMGGLISGIRSRIGALVATLQSITAMIPANKGPKSVDQVLLKPAGQWLMEGLGAGMREGFEQHVLPTLEGITGSIAGAEFTPVNASVAAGNLRAGQQAAQSAGAQAQGGGRSVTINNHYPKPERSSEAISKQLQIANMLDD